MFVLCLVTPVQLFVTPWTMVHQIPLSMGFPRQEYWSGLSFPSPGDLPNPWIEPMSSVDSLLLSHQEIPYGTKIFSGFSSPRIKMHEAQTQTLQSKRK